MNLLIKEKIVLVKRIPNKRGKMYYWNSEINITKELVEHLIKAKKSFYKEKAVQVKEITLMQRAESAIKEPSVFEIPKISEVAIKIAEPINNEEEFIKAIAGETKKENKLSFSNKEDILVTAEEKYSYKVSKENEKTLSISKKLNMPEIVNFATVENPVILTTPPKKSLWQKILALFS